MIHLESSHGLKNAPNDLLYTPQYILKIIFLSQKGGFERRLQKQRRDGANAATPARVRHADGGRGLLQRSPGPLDARAVA